MRLIIDLMGADKSPQILVKGCLDALEKHPNLEITCVVLENLVEDLVKDKKRLNLVYATEVVSVSDNLLTIPRMKNTTMVTAMNLANQENFDGVLSCGSTAAFVACCVFILKRLPNVSRPALLIDLPSVNNHVTTMLDLGANIELSSKAFKELAYASKTYVSLRRNIKDPKIALLNIGEEENKGTKQLKELHQEFKNDENLNFNGNIESRYLVNNNNDIILCDGYSGNIALKAVEGMGVSIFKLIKDASKISLRNKIGLLLLKPFFKGVYKNLDYNNYGGALLLGVKKIAIKAHGSSDAKTLSSAINQFVDIHESEFIKKVSEE